MSEPFDDLMHVILGLPAGDDTSEATCRAALERKPLDPQGGAVDLIAWLARSQGTPTPSLDETHLCLLATSYDKGAPIEPIRAFCDQASKGAAPVNLLCVDDGLGLRVLDLAIDIPHRVLEWTDQEAVAATAYGMEAVAAGGNLLGLADLGFGNQAFALAVAVGVLRGQHDMEPLLMAANPVIREQAATLIAALDQNMKPLEVLTQVGGRDIAAALGALIAGRSVGLPLLIEGVAVLAAVALLEAIRPGAAGHVRLAAVDDPVEKALAATLGLSPIVGLSHGAGPGAGLALAFRHIKASLQLTGLRDRSPDA